MRDTQQLDLYRPVVPPDMAAHLSLRERFESFDRANPHVFDALVRIAHRLRKAGARRLSIAQLFEVLRYDVTIATKGRAWATAGIGLAVGLGCVVGSGLVISGGAELDPGARRALDDLDISIGAAWWQMALTACALVIFAPLGEELLFRGLALRGLVRLMPFAWAAPVSGGVFTAAHFDAYLVWPRAVALVLVGWVLAWLYRRRGLLGSVAAHATVNAIATAALLSQA